MTVAARVALGAVGLLVGVAAVLGLREATLSTHQAVDPGSRTEVVVEARTRGGERSQTLAEMVDAVLTVCRLEVNSDLDGPIEASSDGRFSTALVPALDPTNRRQFKGCVEDWSVDHALLDVVRLETVA